MYSLHSYLCLCLISMSVQCMHKSSFYPFNASFKQFTPPSNSPWSKEREERIQTEIVTVIKLEREKLEEERLKLVEERIRYEEILQEMKQASGKGTRKSTGSRKSSPQSISLQKVSSDQGSRGGSDSFYKSEKQKLFEAEKEKLAKEKAEFEEWKKRFLH